MLTPYFRRKVIAPLHAWVAGSPKYSYWRELEKTQYLSEEELLEKQWMRLKSLFNFVYEKNDFYRKRFEAYGFGPQDIATPEDVRKIPKLTKQEIRAHCTGMISKGYSSESLLRFKTGGSTGRALEIYITEECSELRNACAQRHDRWSGWEIGEPVGAVWGNPDIPQNLKGRLRDWLLSPCIYLDTMSVTDQAVKEFARSWEKSRPTLLFGHAHSLYLLAQYIRKLEISAVRPKAIISTSMMLLPHERDVIEDAFGVKVVDRYGCEEVSLIASECEKHEGMHLNIEHLYIEFLGEDGHPVRAGEPGRIVVTDLMNYAMPFIRYEVEDIGVPLVAKCSCGRGFPLMEKVTGRFADFLIKADGTRIAGVSLIENTLTKIPGIDQMQIIQENFQRITLRVVPGASYSQSASDALKDYFLKTFEQDLDVNIELVGEIRPEQSGKYRFSICKIT
jgi:phenylacetate-CoA ligase